MRTVPVVPVVPLAAPLAGAANAVHESAGHERTPLHSADELHVYTAVRPPVYPALHMATHVAPGRVLPGVVPHTATAFASSAVMREPHSGCDVVH